MICHPEANTLPHTSCSDYGNLKLPSLRPSQTLHIPTPPPGRVLQHHFNNVMQCVMLLLYYANINIHYLVPFHFQSLALTLQEL